MAAQEVGRGSLHSSSGHSPSSDGHDAAIDAEKEHALSKLDSKLVNVGVSDPSTDPFAHLPQHERDIVHRQLNVPEVKVTYATLYRYASTQDLLITALSAVCSIAGGAMMPLMTVCCFGRTSPYPRFRLSLLTRHPDHLRSAGWHISGLLPEDHNTGGFLTHTVALHPVFRLPRDRRVYHNLYLDGRLHICGRTYHSKDSRTIFGCNIAAEYCILR